MGQETGRKADGTADMAGHLGGGALRLPIRVPQGSRLGERKAATSRR